MAAAETLGSVARIFLARIGVLWLPAYVASVRTRRIAHKNDNGEDMKNEAKEVTPVLKIGLMDNK
ncbi:unnamed protein product [Dovyalis caffra]|uniref:Uncharacterized protein n=1 Tax=Dovyalis caffra TaxID=77055 RepID=A0AAV1RK17_9ROSI|nr:unnamed protein product [Dovyalis caffra]